MEYLCPRTRKGLVAMSGIILLQSILEKLKGTYPIGLSDDKLFEFYCADNLLTNFDLDHDEMRVALSTDPVTPVLTQHTFL